MDECARRMGVLTLKLAEILDGVVDQETKLQLVPKLRRWHTTRNFIDDFDCHFFFDALSPFVGFQMCCSLICIGAGVLIMFSDLQTWLSDRSMLGMTLATLAGVFVCSLGSSFVLFKLVMNLAEEDHKQVSLLHHNKLRIIEQSTSLDMQAQVQLLTVISYLEQLVCCLERFRRPPRVLGMSVEPTFLRVFQSIILAGLSSLAAKGVSLMVG